MQKSVREPYFSLFICLSRTLIRVRTPNSNWQIASIVSSGELAIECSCAVSAKTRLSLPFTGRIIAAARLCESSDPQIAHPETRRHRGAPLGIALHPRQSRSVNSRVRVSCQNRLSNDHRVMNIPTSVPKTISSCPSPLVSLNVSAFLPSCPSSSGDVQTCAPLSGSMTASCGVTG